MQNKSNSKQKILNNKIGIQIVVIMLGIILIALGIACSACSYISFDFFKNSYDSNIKVYGYGYFDINAFIPVGMAIAFTGLALIIIGAISIVNYEETKKDLKKSLSAKENIPQQKADTFDDMQQKIASLQQMKDAGLISDNEFAEMKSVIIKKLGGML